MKCYFCGKELVVLSQDELRTGYPGNLRTRDHLIPRCKGGDPRVTVDACLTCNSEKGELLPDEWRVVMAFRNGLITTDFKFAGEQL